MSKKFYWSTLTILVVLSTGLLLTGQTSQAPETTQSTGHSAMMSSPDAHLQMLSEKLNLTDAQKAKAKPILEDSAQQFKAVKDDTSLTPEQKKAKMKAAHESMHNQINAILTPEQQAKFKQMTQEGMEKHKEMKEGQMDH
jgi:periplasmic protein CpxP/Spy